MVSKLYRPNPDFDQAFARSEEAREFALDRARAAAKVAQSLAPVASGAYRDSIEGTVEEGPEGWVGQVVAAVPYALYVEYGTEDTPTFATLRRAGELIERM